MRRLLLIPYPALAAVMGLAYLFGDPARTQTPSFAVARSLAPLPVWGGLFLAGAIVLTAALVAGDRRLMAVALYVGGILYTWWACLFAVAALSDPRASLTGWAVHGMLAFAHYVAAWRLRAGVGL